MREGANDRRAAFWVATDEAGGEAGPAPGLRMLVVLPADDAGPCNYSIKDSHYERAAGVAQGIFETTPVLSAARVIIVTLTVMSGSS